MTREEELKSKIEANKQKRIEYAHNSDKIRAIDQEDAEASVELAGIEQLNKAKEDMEKEQEAAQQVRIQEQEEKVATLTLPYDFNELYGDSTANDSIIEVVQIFIRKDNEEHNAEVEELVSRHREDKTAWSEREIQLQRQLSELQKINNDNNAQAILDAEEFTRLEQQIAQLKTEKADAESKRDAAVAKAEGLELLLTEKEAHIQTLRDENAIGASRTVNITAIEASDRLAALVEKSKNAKIKSAAELALENQLPFRGKITLDGSVAPIALEEPTFPNASHTPIELEQATTLAIPAESQVEPFRTAEVESGNTVDNGPSSEDGQGAVSRAEFEELKGRVNNLYRVANISEVA